MSVGLITAGVGAVSAATEPTVEPDRGLTIAVPAADDGADVPAGAGDRHPDDPGPDGYVDGPEDGEARSGLGDYGTTGPIARDQVPSGDLVSDRSIELAASPRFAEARSRWAEPVDFVDQIDYQLAFRQNYDFLSSDPDHIAQLLVDKPTNDVGFVEMHLFLTEAEAAELRRRDALGGAMERLERLASKPAPTEHLTAGRRPTPLSNNFVDIWQDQLDGGKVFLAVLDEQRLDWSTIRRSIGTGDLEVVEVPYSAADYERFAKLLTRELDRMGVGYLVGTERRSTGLRIEVVVDEETRLSDRFGRLVPADAYTIVRRPTPQLINMPDADHDWGDLSPGQTIWVTDDGIGSWCTWGVNGHTNNWNYLVTAGHCLNGSHQDSSGWAGNDVEVWNGSRSNNAIYKDLTPGNTFVHSQFGGGRDAARILSPSADTNCYHGTMGDPAADCPWAIESRALHNSWEVGNDRTCASLGRSNTYRCGDIQDEGVSVDEDLGGSDRMVAVGFNVDPGDSGAGAKWNETIDGLITVKDRRIFRSDRLLMVTAYDVKRFLGGSFDYNCAPAFVRQAADQWGACPAINR